MARDQRDYASLLAAALWWGTGTSQLILLAAVLERHGMTAPVIATVLSCSSLAMVAALLVSGPLVSRWGAVRSLVLGCGIGLAATIALAFAVDWAVPAAALQVARGFAAGLLLPSGQLVAKSLARDDDQIRAVGMFTAMLLIPTFFGPTLGQWGLLHLGERGFFVMATVPLAIGMLFTLLLSRDRDTPAPPDAAGYLALLRDRRCWLPNLASMQSGLAYAFASTFLPLFLLSQQVAVAAFYAPFAGALFATRFLALKHLQRLAAPRVTMLGLLVYAIGFYALLVPGDHIWAAACAGCLFGLGYGVIVPVTIDWSSRPYPAAARARPVALINTSFNLGSIVALQTTGAVLPMLGWAGVLVSLGTMIALVFLLIAATQGVTSDARQQKPLDDTSAA
jgi:predicted MFS family arabinose efflux permease